MPGFDFSNAQTERFEVKVGRSRHPRHAGELAVDVDQHMTSSQVSSFTLYGIEPLDDLISQLLTARAELAGAEDKEIDLDLTGRSLQAARVYIYDLIDERHRPVEQVRASVEKALRREIASGRPHAENLTAYGHMLQEVEEFEQLMADGQY